MSTLSPEQAAKVADALVQQARLAAAERRDREAPAVPLYLRTHRLTSLRPVERAAVVRDAGRQILTSPVYWFAHVLVWALALCGYLALGQTDAAVYIAAVGALLGSMSLRGVFFRRALARLLVLPHAH